MLSAKAAYVLQSPIKPLRHVESLRSRDSVVMSSTHSDHAERGSPLGTWTIARILSILGGLFLALVQIYLIIAASRALAMAGKQQDSHYAHLERTLRLYTTLLPILFATVMGRFFRALSLYKAQTGICLKTLERFIGCQSSYTAIERQLSLRPIGLSGIALILFWLLSPLASIASLRLLGVTTGKYVTENTVRYLPTISAAQSGIIAAAEVKTSILSGFTTFMAFLQVAVLAQWSSNTPRDYAGYVKIPSIHTFADGSDTLALDTWKNINRSHDVTYSSLLGIPIADLSPNGNTTFELDSRHWTVHCSSIQATTMTVESTKNGSWLFAYQTSLALPDDTTRDAPSWPMKFTSLRGDPQANGFNDKTYEQYPDLPVNVASCSIGPQNVVSNVSCIGTSCEVTSMRFMNYVPVSPALGTFPNTTDVRDDSTGARLEQKDVWDPTLWDDDEWDNSEWFNPAPMGGLPAIGLRMLLTTLPFASCSDMHSAQGSNASKAYDRYTMKMGATYHELWLAGISKGSGTGRYYPWPDYSKMPLEEFSSRLETLINTYWQTFYMVPYLTTVDINHPQWVDGDMLKVPDGNLLSTETFSFNKTKADVVYTVPHVYFANMHWYIVLLGTSILLVVTAIATVALKMLTIAPDIFGFASTCTRDNLYAPDYIDGSYMSGFDRACALVNAKVMIGDVAIDRSVGHVAVTTSVCKRRRLQKGRKYE